MTELSNSGFVSKKNKEYTPGGEALSGAALGVTGVKVAQAADEVAEPHKDYIRREERQRLTDIGRYRDSRRRRVAEAEQNRPTRYRATFNVSPKALPPGPTKTPTKVQPLEVHESFHEKEHLKRANARMVNATVERKRISGLLRAKKVAVGTAVVGTGMAIHGTKRDLDKVKKNDPFELAKANKMSPEEFAAKKAKQAAFLSMSPEEQAAKKAESAAHRTAQADDAAKLKQANQFVRRGGPGPALKTHIHGGSVRNALVSTGIAAGATGLIIRNNKKTKSPFAKNVPKPGLIAINGSHKHLTVLTNKINHGRINRNYKVMSQKNKLATSGVKRGPKRFRDFETQWESSILKEKAANPDIGKRDNRKDVNTALGAVAGGAVADAGLTVGGQSAKAALKIRRAHRGESENDKKIWQAHKESHGLKVMAADESIPMSHKNKVFSSYPKELPDWRLHRALAVKNRPAFTAAAIGTGAVGGAVVARHKSKVGKGLAEDAALAAKAAKKAAKAARPKFTPEEIDKLRAEKAARIASGEAQAPPPPKIKQDPSAQKNVKVARSSFLGPGQVRDLAIGIPVAATGLTYAHKQTVKKGFKLPGRKPKVVPRKPFGEEHLAELRQMAARPRPFVPAQRIGKRDNKARDVAIGAGATTVGAHAGETAVLNRAQWHMHVTGKHNNADVPHPTPAKLKAMGVTEENAAMRAADRGKHLEAGIARVDDAKTLRAVKTASAAIAVGSCWISSLSLLIAAVTSLSSNRS